jgi:hypothetical protein
VLLVKNKPRDEVCERKGWALISRYLILPLIHHPFLHTITKNGYIAMVHILNHLESNNSDRVVLDGRTKNLNVAAARL